MNAATPTRSRHTATALLLAAAALLALTSATGCTTKVVTSPAGAAINSVTASGSGKVSATPDEATMSFGVNSRATDAGKALAAASKTAEKISAAVAKAGVDKEDIQTSGVNLYPQSNSSGKITGYDANLSLNVKIRDLDAIGKVIAAANAAGANNISGPGFGIADDAEYRAQAIEKAVADARKSAEAMAKAAKRTVGEVLSISSSNVNVPGPFYDMALSSKSAGLESVPIEPGQLDVTAELTIVFELK